MPERARVHGTNQTRAADFVYIRSTSGPLLSIWVQADRLTVSGDNALTVARVQRQLEAQLPALAQLFATARIRAAVKQRFPHATDERVGAGAYRMRFEV